MKNRLVCIIIIISCKFTCLHVFVVPSFLFSLDVDNSEKGTQCFLSSTEIAYLISSSVVPSYKYGKSSISLGYHDF
jgi:hypothetical protein